MFPIETVMKRFLPLFCLFLALPALAPAQADPALKSDPKAVARIEGGIVDCPGCQLAGANLFNTCVKAKDLHGANFDGANATLMCMSFANFRGASFRGTILDAANLASAKLDGADMTGARTHITSFLGTDLTHVKGLTQAQLDTACGDAKTKVPAGFKVHFCS
jgi:uncharacterized protein YjbI with pentapeptide repeats